jgi:hypothetical protein
MPVFEANNAVAAAANLSRRPAECCDESRFLVVQALTPVREPRLAPNFVSTLTLVLALFTFCSINSPALLTNLRPSSNLLYTAR